MRAETLFSNFAGIDVARPPGIGQGGARVVSAPAVRASASSLAGFGRPAPDFAATDVTIVTWPQPGWRPVVPGTGNEGGIVEDVFEFVRRGQVQHAVNRAVGRSYVTGWYDDPATAREDVEPRDRTRLFTHEANYHPDGGQVFCPRDGAPFVALLAKPGDDIRPEDFIAFYFDGTFGVHIDPGVWHQPVFPLDARALFDDKQGRVHACIAVDFLSEFGAYVAVPMVPPQG